MISLMFHSSFSAPARVGPAPWFRITGNFIREGPHAKVVSTFHNYTWEAEGRYFTSYDVEGPVVVQFEDALGGRSAVFGPFDAINTTDGVMRVKDALLSKFINETQLWHDIRSDTYWPVIVLESAESRTLI
jgi:hypothetical protein